MKESISLTNQYNRAAEVIKTAILQSQYQAVQKVNSEPLALYFGIGRYISTHSRDNYWGTSALTYISEKLRRDMPGLRGFSITSLKKMRTFFENWNSIFSNRPSTTDKNTSSLIPENITITIRPLTTDELNVSDLESFTSI